MDRSDFLKNVAGAAIAPTLLKDLIDVLDDKNVVVAKIDGKKRVAIDVRALQLPGSPSRRHPSISELLKIYAETGVLIYCTHEDMKWHPITVID